MNNTLNKKCPLLLLVMKDRKGWCLREDCGWWEPSWRKCSLPALIDQLAEVCNEIRSAR